MPDTEQAQLHLAGLLDQFYYSHEYAPCTQFDANHNIVNVELRPSTPDAFALKSDIDTEIALLTAPVRAELALADFQVLKTHGYHLRINKISLDEWRIAVDHRLGTLSCCFIDA